MSVRKAIVLAAGHGTRLRPFTCATPKPLMPVWGVPMIERVVAALREWGVDDFAFNTHCLHEQVRRWTDDYRRECERSGRKAKVKVSYEPEILGTGGALNPLREWIDGEPFYLVNGDIVFENAANPALAPGFDSPSVIASALVAEDGPRTIEVEPESRFVTNWRSQDAGAPGTFTYCGISCLKPEILDFVEPEGFSSIVAAFEKAMLKGKFVKAAPSDGILWADAGTIKSYVELNSSGEENAFADFPQVKAALEAAGRTGRKVEFMGSRGSERVFFKCDDAVVILYDDGNRNENGLYAGHAKWLKSKGVGVPDVLADLPALKTLAIEFAGTERRMSREDYVAVVKELAKFNNLGLDPEVETLGLLPGFDDETWRWERGLFAKFCLAGKFGMEMPEAVRAELEEAAARLEREPKVLVHRDFQSSNILWRGNSPVMIDFQGMRLGPAAYDLASLVFDPYVEIAPALREELAGEYAKAAGRPDIAEILPVAATQRLVQCLGAFGRLEKVGQPQFAKFFAPALDNLAAAAHEAGFHAVEGLAEELHSRCCGHHGHSCSCGKEGHV